MARDVGEGLLENAERRASEIVGQRLAVGRDLYSDLDAGARAEFLPLPLERCLESELIEHARPQLRRDAPHRRQSLIDSLDDRRAPCHHLVTLGQTPLHPRDVELESRQRLAELVVNLARDTGTLFLAHLLQARSERPQLLAGG